MADAGRRAALFVRGLWPSNTAKHIMRELNVSMSSAERLIAGNLRKDMLVLAIEAWGWPFIEFVYAPDGRVDRAGMDFALDVVAAQAEALAQELSEMSRAHRPNPANARGTGCAGGCASDSPDADRLTADNGDEERQGPGGAAARRSGAGAAAIFSIAGAGGRALELNEALPLDGNAVDPRHARVLQAYDQAAGRISPELFGLLDDLGVDGLTSIYDPSVRVVSIGGGIDFWDQSRRQGVTGQSLMALPGPRDYLAAAHNALTDAAAAPQHHRMRVVADGNVAVFRRLALDFPGSALRLGVTVVESITHAPS